MILNISYDLNKAGQNYSDLYDTIKSAPGYIRAMDSYWFICTSESVKTWSDRLRQVIDENDNIFIVDITGQSRQGWMGKNVWEWLKKHDPMTTYTY
jgi:hypothetical protein